MASPISWPRFYTLFRRDLFLIISTATNFVHATVVALLNYCNRLQTSISDSSLAPVELVSSKRCQTNPFKHKSDQCNLFLKAFQWLQSDSSKIIFFSLAPCRLPDPFFTTLSLALAFCFLRYMSSISFSQGFIFTLLSANNALPLHIYMT